MSQRRDVLSSNCPNCGASIQVAPPGQTVACRYCGQTIETPPEVIPPQRIVIATPGTRPLGGRVGRAAGRGVLSAFSTMFILGIVGFLSLRGRTHALVNLPSELAAAASGGLGPFAAKVAATPSFMWDTVAGPPIPAAVGGAGVEGFVGRVRGRGDSKLWIVAFEGSHLGQVWKAGPFGTYSEAYQSTFTSVVGASVVVTDYRASVHVYDVATGHETHTLKLTDRAKAMCAAPDGKAEVWIRVSDEQNVMVDANAGTSASAPRPAWCPDTQTHADCRGWLSRGAQRAGCKGPESAPKVAGFEAVNVLEQGEFAVALGKKHPGTALPIAVGFDPKTKAIRWQQALASGDPASVSESASAMDALSGGRFVAPYEVTSTGWHFTAFDARSGQRAWDVPLASLVGVTEPEGFALSPSRVYVIRTSTLEVYDAKTGALVGTVGD